MNVYSLRTIIDDILLIVRNNNISESEDLSRDLIRAWVMSYKAYLTKKLLEKDEENGTTDQHDDSMSLTLGPLELVVEKSLDDCFKTKRTKDKLPQLMGDSDKNLFNVMDETGCIILYMDEGRRHYHRFRRYTYAEPTCRYSDGYLYIDGYVDSMKNIYITGNFMDDENSDSEDDVIIPGYMIADIKKAILDNELSFMLKRPSDDSNNSTLASVKPHGPQDLEK